MSTVIVSQCTYRCVVLPEAAEAGPQPAQPRGVSMHLQVRGAP